MPVLTERTVLGFEGPRQRRRSAPYRQGAESLWRSSLSMTRPEMNMTLARADYTRSVAIPTEAKPRLIIGIRFDAAGLYMPANLLRHETRLAKSQSMVASLCKLALYFMTICNFR